MDEKILIENTMEIANEEDIIIKKLHIPTTKIEMEDSILVNNSNAVDGNIMQIDPINHEERDDLVECIFEEHEAITFIDDEGTEETAAATVSLERQIKTEKDMAAGDLKGLIDKDDPRSRLHFVKYLKRGGKTLKIWECGICTKEFRHQYTLMRHLPTHTDERNFKCEMCGKAFRQMSTLSQHRAIHSDARPYICEICKKTFNRVSTLISHRKTHSEKKPHNCRVCGKGFHQKGNLRNHVFTHTNERPYRCNICGKGFNQMSNLMCHKVKLCEAEAAKNSIRIIENETYGIRQENGKMVEFSLGEKRTKTKKNMKFVQHVSDDDEEEEEEEEDEEEDEEADSPERSACDDTADSEEEPSAGVCIEPIQTKAMKLARALGQTPFALLKPARGMPVLVKVVDLPSKSKQMLVPATAEDLKNAGKVTVSPSVQSEAMKAVQIKVPVVATVIQQILPDGTLAILIEPPSNESFPKKASHQVARETQESLCDDIITDFPNDGMESEENLQYVVTEDDGSVEWIVEEGDEVEDCVDDMSQAVDDFEPPEVYVLEDVASDNGDVTEDEA